MIQVNLVYTIDTPQGPLSRVGTDTWVVHNDDADAAIQEAKASTEAAVYASLKWHRGVQVVYEEITVHPLEACGTCGGRGRLASMEGFYRCPTCQGMKYHVVEYANQK